MRSGSQRGFTLIEVLAALAIAATSLVVLTGRLGASADLQRGLEHQALMQSAALDVLERSWLEERGTPKEKEGEFDAGGVHCNWKLTIAETGIEGFYRQNVELRIEGEPPLTMFLYRSAK